MSKYGFDEKEVRKTIITMIDKDGFHKEVIAEGASIPGSVDNELSAELFSIRNESDSFINDGYFLIRNIPDNAVVYAIKCEGRSDDYLFNIGDPFIVQDRYISPSNNLYLRLDGETALFAESKAALFEVDIRNTYSLSVQFYAVDSTNSTIVGRASALFMPGGF